MTGKFLHWCVAAASLALSGCAAPALAPLQADAPPPSDPVPVPPAVPVPLPGPTTDPVSLVGTRWVLVEAWGEPVPPRPPVTLNFEVDRFGGHGGCNGYGAEYRIDGRRIVIGLVSSTLVGCSGPVGDVEERFFRGIGGAFEVAHRPGLSLTIVRDSRPALHFAPSR